MWSSFFNLLEGQFPSKDCVSQDSALKRLCAPRIPPRDCLSLVKTASSSSAIACFSVLVSSFAVWMSRFLQKLRFIVFFMCIACFLASMSMLGSPCTGLDMGAPWCCTIFQIRARCHIGMRDCPPGVA